MHDSPLRVFVGSRSDEFSQERVAIEAALSSLPLVKPVLVEEMPAIPKPNFDAVNAEVSKADIFMVIFGEKFSEQVRMEYEIARANNKPTLLYAKDVSKREEELNEFLNQIGSKFAISKFHASDDLAATVRSDVTNLLIQTYRRFNLNVSDFTEPSYKKELQVRSRKSRRDKKLCFVIMPIGLHGSREYDVSRKIFDLMIKPAVELDDEGKPTGLKCERADQEVRTGNIPRDIVEKLVSAEIVIADLSNKNPNVFYELGVRHSIRQKTIMIAQNVEEIPFDLRSYRTVIYDPIVGFVDKSIRELRLTVRVLMATKEIKDSPVLDWVRRVRV